MSYISSNNVNSTTLNNYSDAFQKQAKSYKTILKSDEEQRNYVNLEEASKSILNPNVPNFKSKKPIKVGNQNIMAMNKFPEYKQYAGSIFTSHLSAGAASIYEDLAVRDLPAKSLGLKESTPNLVLSNTNLVRNNLQNYGNTFLLGTNLLNSIASNHGYDNQSNSSSPYRNGSIDESFVIFNSHFKDVDNGNLYTRNVQVLRHDLPSNYAQTSLTTWQLINPMCIIPNPNEQLPWIDRLKSGTFNLDALVFIGNSCLTKDFNIVPEGFDKPVDVYNGFDKYPPVSNIEYYQEGPNFKKIKGPSEGLYCSPNSNYISVPINFKYPNLDTSINISPGNNSIALGMTMTPSLRNFINIELFNINRELVLLTLILQYKNSPQLLNTLKQKYPEIDKLNKVYNTYNEREKYIHLFNIQRRLNENYIMDPQVQMFVNGLDIIKIGDKEKNIDAYVMLDDITYKIDGNIGCFLLLSNMLSDDLFNIKEGSIGDCNNSIECCFDGPANSTYSNQTFYPSVESETGLNLSNLRNAGCGTNPYNAPDTF